MKIVRYASARWSGGLKDGKGEITTQSGAISSHPYGYASRFEGVAGTNPEELLGAAHAGCFAMALSAILGKENLTADSLDTKAHVTLEQKDGGFSITAIHLELTAKVPGVDQETFEKLASAAKASCPVSRVLNADISLTATLSV